MRQTSRVIKTPESGKLPERRWLGPRSARRRPAIGEAKPPIVLVSDAAVGDAKLG
jgi:hypothetical protein